jgi:hypothetical protein|tara:strand:- start:1005 stop:1130 length:126 start_codon:yes stop_codon:yes gene_type:complete
MATKKKTTENKASSKKEDAPKVEVPTTKRVWNGESYVIVNI